MRFLRRRLGRTDGERRTNAAALVDEVPRGRRVDDPAREQLTDRVLGDSSRRDALRLGAMMGGGVLAGFFAGHLATRAGAAPGDGIGGTTLSDTDIDAKRIAGVRIASEFAAAKHAGTAADPWPGAAIQSAMDDIPSAGGMAFVPPGVWNVSSPLRITRSNLTLAGTGPATDLVTNGSGFTANSSGMIEISGQLKGALVERLSLNGTNTDTCRGVLITGGAE